MIHTHIVSRRPVWVTLAALVVVLALVAVWPVKAQPRSRRVLASPPIKVMNGHRVLMACLNGGPRQIRMRFNLVDARSGMPVESSDEQVVGSRTAGFFDIFVGLDGLYYQGVELAGPAGSVDAAACSLQVVDEMGGTVVFIQPDRDLLI
jgi:hypothetical protein